MMFKIDPTESVPAMSYRYPETDPSRLHGLKSGFMFEGLCCAATLYEAAGAALPSKAPAILMVHGWSGVQRALTVPFIQRFVDAGYAVMEFDYPGFGASAGWPRQNINPWRWVRVADAALAHLKSQSQVDADRIVLWGTSFGGGHVVDLAAEHPELLGAIAQVPMLDGMAAVGAVPILRMLKFGLYALADLLKPGRPVYIPSVASPGQFGTMDRDGARQALMSGTAAAGISFDNRVTARSVLTMGPYRPIRRLRRLRIPTLLIGATRDTVAPFVEKAVRASAPDCVQLCSIDANHFEPYFEPAFSVNVGHQLRFLQALLSPERPVCTAPTRLDE